MWSARSLCDDGPGSDGTTRPLQLVHLLQRSRHAYSVAQELNEVFSAFADDAVRDSGDFGDVSVVEAASGDLVVGGGADEAEVAVGGQGGASSPRGRDPSNVEIWSITGVTGRP